MKLIDFYNEEKEKCFKKLKELKELRKQGVYIVEKIPEDYLLAFIKNNYSSTFFRYIDLKNYWQNNKIYEYDYYLEKYLKYNGKKQYLIYFGNLLDELDIKKFNDVFITKIQWTHIGGKDNFVKNQPNIDIEYFELFVNGEINESSFIKMTKKEQKKNS
jgi:hypothetical protein